MRVYPITRSHGLGNFLELVAREVNTTLETLHEEGKIGLAAPDSSPEGLKPSLNPPLQVLDLNIELPVNFRYAPDTTPALTLTDTSAARHHAWFSRGPMHKRGPFSDRIGIRLGLLEQESGE